MKSYKVIALSVGGKSNKIFEFGQVVNEDAFEEGHAEILTSKGFLEPATTPVLEPSTPGADEAKGVLPAANILPVVEETAVIKKGRPKK